MEVDNTKILVVDDEPYVRDLLTRMLVSGGYESSAAPDGETAVKMLEQGKFQLVLSDIMMPGMSGLDLLTTIRCLFPDVAVLMVTALDDQKTAVETLEIGAYGYLTKPMSRNTVLINVANALERRRLSLLSQDYERELEERVRERTTQLRKREEETVLRLMSAMDYRDDETGSHARRLGLYAAVLAKALGWNQESADNIRLAAPIHDLGKIGIPDGILQKPGALTPHEFEVMQTHSEIGARILGNSEVPMLQMARDIALYHHERWDGSGYPKKLSDEEIPECARIVGLVDVYDALLHDRVYRPALPEEKALEIMTESYRDNKYEPRIFECFLDFLPALRLIRDEVREESRVAGLSKEEGLTESQWFPTCANRCTGPGYRSEVAARS